MRSGTGTDLLPPAGAPTTAPDARIWAISELAKEFGITARTIRFYEDEGLIKPRRQGLTRLYSAGDRARLGWILRGKRLGFSLAEIRALIDLYYVDRSGMQQMRAILATSREHIAELERKLRDLQAQLAEFRAVEASVLAALAGKGHKAEVREQNTEVRGQRAEVRREVEKA